MSSAYRDLWGPDALTCSRSKAKLNELLGDSSNFQEQRTPAWHAMREKVLTASNFYDICVTRGATVAKILNEKLFPAQFPRQEYALSYPLFHGCRCESAAQSFYEWYTGSKLHAFGLVVGRKEKFIASSPDGINNYGIMAEFKCPVSRPIEQGKVPVKYMYQIYGQLHTCELLRCDYLECVFGRACNPAEWLSAESFKYKTILIFTQDVYEGIEDKDNWVGSFDMTPEEILIEADLEVARRFAGKTKNQRVVCYYLIMTDFNLVKVEYDPEIASKMVSCIKEVADLMEEHRARQEVISKPLPKSTIKIGVV